MAKDTSDLIRRIDERIALLNTSREAASREAVGQKDMIRNIARGSMPLGNRLDKLAAVLKTTSQWLLTGEELPAAAAPATTGVAAAPSIYRPKPNDPKDVPVLGTAEGAYSRFDEGGSLSVSESTDISTCEIVDWLRRPPGIATAREVYGLYCTGWSMSPKYEDGDEIYVDPRHRVQIGDYVIVQMVEPGADGEARFVKALLKRLVRRTSEYVELEQFEPRGTFRVETSRIAAIHHVMTQRELLGN